MPRLLFLLLPVALAYARQRLARSRRHPDGQLTLPCARSRSSSSHSSFFCLSVSLRSLSSLFDGRPVHTRVSSSARAHDRRQERAPLIDRRSSSSHLISSDMGEICDPGVTIERNPSRTARATILFAAAFAARHRISATRTVLKQIKHTIRVRRDRARALRLALPLALAIHRRRHKVIDHTEPVRLDRLPPQPGDLVDNLVLFANPLAPDALDRDVHALGAVRVVLAREVDEERAADAPLEGVVVDVVQLEQLARDLGFRVVQQRMQRKDQERRVDLGGRERRQAQEVRERERAAGEQQRGDFLRATRDGLVLVLVLRAGCSQHGDCARHRRGELASWPISLQV